jgi:hypothetical protein
MSYYASRLGCAGLSVQFALILLNSFFLLMSGVVFGTTGALFWSSSFKQLVDNNNSNSTILIDKLGGVVTSVLVVSSFCLVLSVVGLVGACRHNRAFLALYELIVLMLFLVKSIALLVLLGASSTVAANFRADLNNTILATTNANSSQCAESLALSQLFNCCGYSNASDFSPIVLANDCCVNVTLPGCADTIVNDVESGALTLLILPTVTLLGA